MSGTCGRDAILYQFDFSSFFFSQRSMVHPRSERLLTIGVTSLFVLSFGQSYIALFRYEDVTLLHVRTTVKLHEHPT